MKKPDVRANESDKKAGDASTCLHLGTESFQAIRLYSKQVIARVKLVRVMIRISVRSLQENLLFSTNVYFP